MGEVNKKSLTCYNTSCGKTFDPADNEDGSCTFHSGVPYFHDAYKEWTCCKRRSTDFTEFLNFKGCTVGKHNGKKPISNKSENKKPTESIFQRSTDVNKIEEVEEISLDLPLIQLTPEISPRLLQQLSIQTSKPELEVKNDTIPVGTPCKNTSCTVSYAADVGDNCVYHPGSAVFHEGLKYWSCCRKMTSDFSKFLDQMGCTVGNHVWFKEKETINCRMDWHQTGSKVEISIFAKNYDPHKSSVALSPMRLNVYIYFPDGEQIFEREYNLCGVVRVDESHVSMLPTKIEIKLTKAKGESWSNLSK